MDVTTALQKFRELQETSHAYSHALGVLYYDGATTAPAASAAGRGRTMGTLAGIHYDLTAGEETIKLIDFLKAHLDELTDVQKREVTYFARDLEYTASIPKEEFVAYQVLLNDAEDVWRKAKNENDFDAFAPYLEKIFDTNRRFAGYYKPDMAPYDVLLNTYEHGLTMAQCDAFFAALREKVVPLLEKVVAAPKPDTSFLQGHFPLEKQRAFSDRLMELMKIDRSRCAIGETEHPFTTGFNNHDVRITTHYHEEDAVSSMYSVIHEGGHALYDMGSADEYEYTCLAGGVSMGIHESQSRFWENIIGRSEEFCALVLPVLQELFPENFANVTPEQLYKAVNKSEPSLIRTEADELTYALHIMVRYDLEKALMEGSLTVKELPAAWNAKMKEYLGVDVPDDARGVLQDTHWAGGMVGYFPSYALGSAYGAQMLAKMKEDLDVSALISAGETDKIAAWLEEKLWRHGSRYDPDELFLRCCEASFDPKWFTDYLTEKFTKVYNLV